MSVFTLQFLASGSNHSALDPAGPQAKHIAGLWWMFFWVCLGVYLVVLAVMMGSAMRARITPAPGEPPARPVASRERRLGAIVAGAMVVTVLLLFVLLFGDIFTGRAVHGFSNTSNQITIRVTGHQWWWALEYVDPTPSNTVTTANEIHIPVGRPIQIELNSTDVIHSFWVPSLHGKKDLVPGHRTTIWLQADRPGTYWGQCAEYCGLQHALMRLVVVAEPEDVFDAWLKGQRQSAAEPATDSEKHGQQVFLSTTCVMCHTITGTIAGGRVGPDLTHLASRSILAAGAIPNARGHLAGWIADPQTIKPGAKMPQNPLPPEDLRDLVDYLEALK